MLTEGFVCPGNGQKGIGSGVNLRREEDTDATDFFHRDRYTDPHKGGDRLRIYLDLAILLNTVVDFMLLMGTNALAGFPSGWKRNLAAAVLGGFYGGLGGALGMTIGDLMDPVYIVYAPKTFIL